MAMAMTLTVMKIIIIIIIIINFFWPSVDMFPREFKN